MRVVPERVAHRAVQSRIGGVEELARSVTKSEQNSSPLQVKFTKTTTSARWLLGADVHFVRLLSLTKREIKGLNAKIEELDFEGSV
jgi:hypothetical protein